MQGTKWPPQAQSIGVKDISKQKKQLFGVGWPSKALNLHCFHEVWS